MQTLKTLIKFYFICNVIYYSERLSKEILKIGIPTVCDIKMYLSEEVVDYSHCEPVFTVIELSLGKLFKQFLINSYS